MVVGYQYDFFCEKIFQLLVKEVCCDIRRKGNRHKFLTDNR